MHCWCSSACRRNWTDRTLGPGARTQSQIVVDTEKFETDVPAFSPWATSTPTREKEAHPFRFPEAALAAFERRTTCFPAGANARKTKANRAQYVYKSKIKQTHEAPRI